ncbi:MAG: hypothetical protein U0R51_00230 [Solirubrobacterales bacterium]
MRYAQTARRALLLCLVTSALPVAGAEAATFSVDSIGTGSDLSINGTCDSDATADTDCSLRAAIEEANATTAADKIFFKGGSDSPSDPDDFVFDRNSNGVIGGTLPTITHPLTIDGGDCLPSPDVPLNPCVRLSTGVTVDSDGEVAIKGLAFSNAAVAIHVVHVASTLPGADFVLAGSWFGLDVSGAKQAPPGTAVLLEDVTGAEIGGPLRDQRNLFARQGTGVDVLGADDTLINGNWFGLAPDGSFARTGEGAAANGDAIEVTGNSVPSPDDQATGTEIGAAAGGFENTAECDGLCNTIVGAGLTGAGNPASGTGIDLGGESGDGEIAAQDVKVAGNVVGTDAIPNNGGINVGNATDVTIGGAALAARNQIQSIGSEAGATGLSIRNNEIGSSASSAAPVTLSGSGEVIGNFVGSGTASAAIQLVNTPAPGFVVQGNVIGEDADGNAVSSGRNGILVNNSATGNLIGGAGVGEGNVVSNLHSTAPPTFNTGIVIAGDQNEVVGNTVGAETDGTPTPLVNGILLIGDADDNLIGGNTAADENEIVNTAQGVANIPAAAIRVTNASAAVTSSGNQILRNHGSANEDIFIDLGDDGAGNAAGGPNGGIQAPVIADASPTTASGTAAPNSVVRIFTKTVDSPGEVEGFLVQATADAGGDWTTTYPSQSAGRRLTATATGAAGTSELSAVALVTEPPPPDTTPPDTAITTKPKDKIKLKGRKKTAKATYAFTATEGGSTFTCRLDAAAPAPCASPLKLTKLKKGRHTFTVFATDAAGNPDATAATDTFKVVMKKKKRRR